MCLRIASSPCDATKRSRDRSRRQLHERVEAEPEAGHECSRARESVMEPATEPPRALAPYVAMTELFVSGQIDALEFESTFWSEFRDLRDISDEDFAVLNELFYVVEDFVADVTARDPGDVTQVELLAAAHTFLDACRR